MSPPGRPLRIAMVAPPYFTVPPDGYGGVEAVVADLVDALVARGHHITLLAAGSHGTRAQEFVRTYDEPVPDRLGEPLPEILSAARVSRALESLDVDLVHDHTAAGPLLAVGRAVPTVVTAHGPVSGDLGRVYATLGPSLHLVALSDAQRAMAPDLPWVGTVHNAVHVSSFPFRAEKEEFALFLGRFHPEKAPHFAIDAARAAGVPLVLAGKCSEPIERDYYRSEVEPRLGPDTEVIGIAGPAKKRELLSRARCLVFPICWDEPFGLVMVESLACGTPVVALRQGAVEELLREGVTGIVVDKETELADAILASSALDPYACRREAEERFDVTAMASGYEQVYLSVLGNAG
ncbi:MAG: glycosyltransferase family 4 protein [Actinomycetota bacterium]|nr:glycosyltransferase family 4 protein [Actinomycetota bacterium]